MKTNKKYMGWKEFLFKNLSSSQKTPLDSLFIDNSIAAAGADLVLKNKIPNDQITYIFDNEPRNKEIVKRMYSVIRKKITTCRVA